MLSLLLEGCVCVGTSVDGGGGGGWNLVEGGAVVVVGDNRCGEVVVNRGGLVLVVGSGISEEVAAS